MLHVGMGRRCLVPYNNGFGILQSLPAAAAFSLRKLSRAYAGAAVNIRRSSDNAQQDIGFDGQGNFNVAAFSAFIGAGSGFVTKWYDQSGNGNNASQSTAANQPQLVLNQQNGKPGVKFNGSAQALVTSAGGATGSFDHTLNIIQWTVSGSDWAYGLALSPISTTNANSGVGTSVTTYFANFAGFGFNAGNSTDESGAAHVFTKVYQAGSHTINGWVDGSSQANSSANTYNLTSVAIALNETGAGANYGTQFTFEAIVYLSALSSSSRQLLETNQKAYWGTP
jgi:hypothetical protein